MYIKILKNPSSYIYLNIVLLLQILLNNGITAINRCLRQLHKVLFLMKSFVLFLNHTNSAFVYIKQRVCLQFRGHKMFPVGDKFALLSLKFSLCKAVW